VEKKLEYTRRTGAAASLIALCAVQFSTVALGYSLLKLNCLYTRVSVTLCMC